ncbi:MAG: hypothetical protein IJ374_10955, partial [Lachnospiraceae bacterium]|nr:hypothetical protein [Lachnospiraceae bacterium]
LGVSLLATQYTDESDSFDNQYDKDAEYAESLTPPPADAVAVSTFEELEAALDKGGNIKLTANISLLETLNVSESAAIYGQGHTITRADGYTGTVFSVKADSNLTMENITLDGSGATATGNLIATEGNGSIVLNAGTVIQNNNGAHAVSLATRGGGSLTLNGAQILNNSSDSGAIWAGGDVIVNEGSKISNNSSTGLAGAIRMVAGSAFTMNGGEISNNTAATDGGAIWGYNASGYYFNGGSIENNSAQGAGGAIYPGQGSQFYISDDFVMTNNTATDSGAIRFTSGCQLHMSGGEISGNISSDSGTNYSYNATTNITGGVFADNMTIGGWVGSTTIGNSFTGILKLEMTHKNVQLTDNFDGIKFEIINVETTYADYKFIPAEGYTYTEGDETKLICMNEGYEVCWDATSSTFKLQATN